MYDPAVRITAVGDCGVDRYLNLGRDRPGGITLNFAAEGFFDSVMDAPSPGLRAVDFGDLAGVTGGTGILERYRDGFHLGFFGLGAGEDAVVDELERLARSVWARSRGRTDLRTRWASSCLRTG